MHREDSGHKDFREVQRRFAAQIRMPEAGVADGVDPGRLKIYQELFFNNIESLLASGFPVLKSLYDDEAWRSLVRQFMSTHVCRTPYFLQIGTEFLDFLANEHVLREVDPPFIGELAHYEWVELALDVVDEEIPAEVDSALPVLDTCLVVSPVAWPLVYQYPVHKINAHFRPVAPLNEPTCLLVYRNRADSVQFIETNPITVHLLQILGETSGLTARQVLHGIAAELGSGSADEFVAFGGATLESFRQLGIVVAR